MLPPPSRSIPAAAARQGLLLVVLGPQRHGQAGRRAAGSMRCCYSRIGTKRARPGIGVAAMAAAVTMPRGGGAFQPLLGQQQLLLRRGLASEAPSKQEQQERNDKGKGDDRGVLIYKGGHADVIRTLKRVSLTTCVIGLASSPFFLALGSESVPMAANAALTGIVLLATCGPTALLNVFVSPYIFTLRLLPPDGDGSSSPNNNPRFRAVTMDFITRRVTSEFALADVKPLPQSTRPFTTFEAKGKVFFVHGETFADKALLQKLLGRPLKEAETAPVDPPEDDEEEEQK